MKWAKLIKSEKYPKIVEEKPEITKTAGNHSEQLYDLSDFTRKLIPVLENLRSSIRFIEEDDKYVDFDSLLPELIESIKNTKMLASTFLHDVKIFSERNQFGEKTADAEQEGITFEQLSPEAKKKAIELLSEYENESKQGIFEDLLDDLLQNKYKEYELESDILDIDEDSYGRINVSLKSGKKIWPAFSNILVPIARKEFEKVIGNSDYFKNEETLMDWVREATSDLYYENHYDWFVPYATLNDVEGIDGWKLSNDIAEAANDEGREQIEKVLEQIGYDLTKEMEYQYFTEQEAIQYSNDMGMLYNEDGTFAW